MDVWRSHGVGSKRYPNHMPDGLKVEVSPSNVADEELLSLRLVRDGWLQTQNLRKEFIDPDNRYGGYVTVTSGVRHKQNPCGGQMLTMTTLVSGFNTHELYSVRYTDGKEHRLTETLWADWDHCGRLVYVRKGKLFAVALGEGKIEMEHELADFNGNQPYTMVAPDWAKVW